MLCNTHTNNKNSLNHNNTKKFKLLYQLEKVLRKKPIVIDLHVIAKTEQPSQFTYFVLVTGNQSVWT